MTIDRRSFLAGAAAAAAATQLPMAAIAKSLAAPVEPARKARVYLFDSFKRKILESERLVDLRVTNVIHHQLDGSKSHSVSLSLDDQQWSDIKEPIGGVAVDFTEDVKWSQNLDYGVTLRPGDTFTVDFGPSGMTLA
jgi:hypothetical protein